MERDRRTVFSLACLGWRAWAGVPGLACLGWRALTVWECEMRDKEVLKKRLESFLVGPEEEQE